MISNRTETLAGLAVVDFFFTVASKLIELPQVLGDTLALFFAILAISAVVSFGLDQRNYLL